MFSAAGVFALAAAVGAVAVDARREVWLVFGLGAAALIGSFEGAGFAAGFATGFAAGLAAAAGFETGAAVECFGMVGVFGAAFGSGLLMGVLLDAEALVVEIAAGFLDSGLPFVVGAPFNLALLAAGFGVSTAGSAGTVGAVSALAGCKSSAG